ncbi:MAG TPA: MlaD family protein [Verrucomicrobiae bacterium]|nr:MlaD family protein [Verrucomicrobiae bacterium]
MKNSLETKLGVFVILAILAAIFIIETLGGSELFHPGYRLTALFDNVQALKPGDSVKMAGVEIGRVENIELTDQKVKVTLKLNHDAVVKTDSKAVIKFTGLGGQNFVSIGFGSPDAPRAVESTVLETQEQPDLNTIMSKLDSVATGVQNLTKSFTGDKIDNLLGPLTDLIRQNTGRISMTLSNIESISSQVAGGQGTVGKLIYDQSFYNSAMATVSNLEDTAVSARDILNTVTNGQGTLGKLLTDDTFYKSATASMTNLNQILLKINQGQGTVGKLVNDQEFYKNAKLSLQKLDKAADSLEDQGPLSVVGIIVGNLL